MPTNPPPGDPRRRPHVPPRPTGAPAGSGGARIALWAAVGVACLIGAVWFSYRDSLARQNLAALRVDLAAEAPLSVELTDRQVSKVGRRSSFSLRVCGRVRNDSPKECRLVTVTLELRDGTGRVLETAPAIDADAFRPLAAGGSRSFEALFLSLDGDRAQAARSLRVTAKGLFDPG